MNRTEYINTIVKHSARFVEEVDSFNSLNKYDINIHAESFLIPVLNEVFGLSLENVNSTQKKNFPAIDLADFQNRVAFQITSTKSFEKIKSTLEKFNYHGLNKSFDVLYFYILTEKKEKYNDDKLTKFLPTEFGFSTSDHVLDKNDILKRIEGISSTPKIAKIARLYEHEFSDIQIEARQQKYKAGYLNNEEEEVCPNLIGITVPKVLYKAELSFDEDIVADRINEYRVSKGKRKIKNFRKEKLIKEELRDYHAFNDDWIVFENWLYTFRDLHEKNEALNKIVDVGTITPINSQNFYETNDDYSKVFKNILRQTFKEFCKSKSIEWVNRKNLFRYRNDKEYPSEKEIDWVGKKKATRKVISAIRNKNENHIICFRNLAFKCLFLCLEKEWFLVINPTWSFTNPSGYYTSRFEPSYMSGLKRMENNKSVFNVFRFVGYHLAYSDLFSKVYPYLKINKSVRLKMIPRIEEDKWNPSKMVEKVDVDNDVELSLEYELFDESNFE